jgi:hypothetical protein
MTAKKQPIPSNDPKEPPPKHPAPDNEDAPPAKTPEQEEPAEK